MNSSVVRQHAILTCITFFIFSAVMAAKGDWSVRFHFVDADASTSERARLLYIGLR